MADWTRQQLAERLDVSVATIRAWERAGAGKPSQTDGFQSWSPATYTAADVALFTAVAHAARIGLTGKRLADVWNTLQPLRDYLTPGWTGLAVTTSDAHGWLIGKGVPGPPDLDGLVTNLPNGVEIRTVTVMEVPA